MTNSIAEILGKTTFERDPNKRAAPHDLAHIVNMIKDDGYITKKYGYTYWLGKVKRSGITYSETHAVLKEIRNMPDKYSKGGRLTNILTKLAQKRKNYDTTKKQNNTAGQ